MSLRGEVRLFMSEVRERAAGERGALVELRGELDRLREQNRELLDRLMARDFGEFSAVRFPKAEVEQHYDPGSDADLAGEELSSDEIE